MLLIAITLFNAGYADWSWLQRIDNQSSCTLQLIEHTQSLDVAVHNAPSTIPAHSEGFIETTGTDESQFVNGYAVICNKQPVGIGQIYDNNWEEDDYLFFQGNGISWEHESFFHFYPGTILVANK